MRRPCRGRLRLGSSASRGCVARASLCARGMRGQRAISTLLASRKSNRCAMATRATGPTHLDDSRRPCRGWLRLGSRHARGCVNTTAIQHDCHSEYQVTQARIVAYTNSRRGLLPQPCRFLQAVHRVCCRLKCVSAGDNGVSCDCDESRRCRQCSHLYLWRALLHTSPGSQAPLRPAPLQRCPPHSRAGDPALRPLPHVLGNDGPGPRRLDCSGWDGLVRCSGGGG